MTQQNDIKLEVSSREPGKATSRRLRREKQVPAVVYGTKVKNTNIYTEEKWIKKYSTHEFENAIFNLVSSDSKLNGTQVLMKKIDIHPVSRRPVHVDFFAVDMMKVVTVKVELRYEGKAAGLQEGGILQPIRRELEVTCLPKSIPDFIEIDVTNIALDETLHLEDITLPDGVKATTSENISLVTVAEVKEEPVETVAAESEEGEATEGEEAAPAEGATPTAEGEKKE